MHHTVDNIFVSRNLMRALLLIVVLALAPASFANSLHIAVASNFRAPLESLLAHFSKAESVTISSASSGTLYAQILNGAPYDIFLAANTDFPERLTAAGLALEQSKAHYAVGQLVLVYQPQHTALAEAGIGGFFAHHDLTVAIANPRLAPYGAAAQLVLDRFSTANLTIVRGNNINQAYQLWHSGGADAALVARSQASPPWLDIPSSWYGDLSQQAVILQRSDNVDFARYFMNWLLSDSTQNKIAAMGYGVDEHR
jgi:molybdate transport system substrate-binding protein